ncbi:MAG: hypothetical protein BJ554DRAFT_2781, partial [Olpidium bornovanus]
MLDSPLLKHDPDNVISIPGAELVSDVAITPVRRSTVELQPSTMWIDNCLPGVTYSRSCVL